MPQFIVRLTLKQPDALERGLSEAEAGIAQRHFEYVQGLGAEDKVILAGRTQVEDARNYGVVILEVADEAEARTIVEADPAVAGGLMDAELLPYQVVASRREV